MSKVRLVLTAKDIREANIGSIRDCPVARALKRRVKKDSYVSVGSKTFSLSLPGDACIDNFEINYNRLWDLSDKQRQFYSKAMYVNVEIPERYLK